MIPMLRVLAIERRLEEVTAVFEKESNAAGREGENEV
jgi:hypothetical protein